MEVDSLFEWTSYYGRETVNKPQRAKGHVNNFLFELMHLETDGGHVIENAHVIINKR
jgi:hypothetical protein